MMEAPRDGTPGRTTLGEWAKDVADRALDKAARQPAWGRRGNREKELFALRAQHVRTLFRVLESLAGAVNREAHSTLIAVDKAFNPKNLGGIEVPDGARFVLKFLERRLEVVLSPLVNIGGARAPLRALATASGIPYHPPPPSRPARLPLTPPPAASCARPSSGGQAHQPDLRRRDGRPPPE